MSDNDKEPKETRENIINARYFFADAKRLLSFSAFPWSTRTVLEKSYTAVLVVVMLGCLPMSYSFYDNLRFVICICLYYFLQIISPIRDKHQKWFMIFILLMGLYNPIFPVRLGEKVIWLLLNIGTLLILFKARAVFDEDKTPE